MGSKTIHFEILIIYFLLLTPCPFTQVLKYLCSKDSSRLVRKIVRSKWTPILDKYQVKLPLECPLHPIRDSFAPRQDAKKRDRPTQWTCRLCGKSFYQEKFLDLHFESRHKSVINEAEDAICLADFCDIMRCEVFQTEESSSLRIGEQLISTDIEVWGDPFGQSSALAKANVAYLSLLPIRTSSVGTSKVQSRQIRQEQIGRNLYPQTDKININDNLFVHNNKARYRPSSYPQTYSTGSTVVSSSSTASSYNYKTPASTTSIKNELSNNNSTHTKEGNKSLSNNNNTKTLRKNDNTTAKEEYDDDDDNGSQKVKANCNIEELSQLKAKCEFLVRSCIGGLILKMTDQNFQEMEEELNKAVCWYLTCERYWEDGPLEPRAFPWGLILILTFVLSTGICFCYYIIWILFDSSEETNVNNVNHHQGYENIHHSDQSVGTGEVMLHPQEHYHYQEYPTTGIHRGVISEQAPEDIQFYYTQQQQQQQYKNQHPYPHPHPHPHQHQHQQSNNPLNTSHDIYPEPVLYDYRHSPRRYIGDQRPPGTPTITMPMLGGVGQTPLRHQSTTTGLVYQQDILDRHDYTNRPIATSAVSGDSDTSIRSIAAPSAANHSVTPLLHGSKSHGVNVSGTTSGKQYNTIPRPLEARQRYVSGSQQSLRTSASNNETIQNEVGQNEHYIYVTYPPDLKKRYFE